MFDKYNYNKVVAKIIHNFVASFKWLTSDRVKPYLTEYLKLIWFSLLLVFHVSTVKKYIILS